MGVNLVFLLLKELRNCILCIIRVRSLFCLVWVYRSLNFLRILLVKLGFSLSVFQFLVFLYLWVYIFSFALYFELNVFLKELRNPVLRIILVWSLFCLNGFVQVCLFYLFLFFWKTNFSSFCAFCLFCFELNVLNQDFNICVIII